VAMAAPERLQLEQTLEMASGGANKQQSHQTASLLIRASWE